MFGGVVVVVVCAVCVDGGVGSVVDEFVVVFVVFVVGFVDQ